MRTKASIPGAGLPLLSCVCALAALFAPLPSARAADADAACVPGHPKVEVVVEGLRSERGDVVAELYPDSPKNFLSSRSRLARNRAKAAPGATVCLPAPQAGYFVVVVYHDEDGDRHFSKNFLGLPAEGFGVSNNPPPSLGKPSFSKVRFEVGPDETTIHVRVRYGLGGGSK